METLDKQEVVDLVQQIPDRIAVDDLIERIILLSKIERSRRQIADGQFFTQNEMKDLA